MHHHRLVLNGPPEHVEALARALLAAGAEADPGADPSHLTWATPTPASLPALCAEHPRAVVGVERFALLGPALERFVLRGADVTVLERRPFAPVTGDDPHPMIDDATLAECAPLPPALLHAAAVRVAGQPLHLGPRPTVTALDDALLVGVAIGRLGTAALDAPFEDDAGPPTVLDALAGLAAAALTAAADVPTPPHLASWPMSAPTGSPRPTRWPSASASGRAPGTPTGPSG